MDLQERRQLDVAERVHKVRAKAKAWRYVLALVIAVAGAVAAVAARGSAIVTITSVNKSGISHTSKIIFISGGAAFFVFGMIAAIGLAGVAKGALEPLVGKAHAGIVRYVLLVVGVFTILTLSLALLGVSPRQLLVGGAVTGVLLGIAAQQSLANIFAGLVLLFASPFRVGDRVSFRSGSISGPLEGVVTDLSLTYVSLQTVDGRVLVPNSQALASAVMLVPEPPHASGGHPRRPPETPAAEPPVPDH
jgi:small-conductance mechanosensitive channel